MIYTNYFREIIFQKSSTLQEFPPKNKHIVYWKCWNCWDVGIVGNGRDSMGTLMERDKPLINFLECTNLPITIDQASRLFYNAGTEASRKEIARRRMNKLLVLEKLKRTTRDFGEEYAYYLNYEPIDKAKELMLTEFVSRLDLKILEVQTDFVLIQEEYNWSPLIHVVCEYKDKIIRIFLVDKKDMRNGGDLALMIKDESVNLIKRDLRAVRVNVVLSDSDIEGVITVNTNMTNVSKIKELLAHHYGGE